MKGRLDPSFWRDRRVFLTGHTGFKGSWLSCWLNEMGADVTGFALPPDTNPSLFRLLQLDQMISSKIGDIRAPKSLREAMVNAKPEVVFHLAAQPIVSTSFLDPVGTLETNMMGTAHLLEVCRELGGDLIIIVVSSDKCYRNDDSGQAFRVNDPLGGNDPYSASKAGTEIIAAAYSSSFFAAQDGPVLASARAGNVIGGGDWSRDRLLPDAARAFSQGEPLVLRNPDATRPWQHVIEPLMGYLVLAEAVARDRSLSGPWNFGPSGLNNKSVREVACQFAKAWKSTTQIETTSKEQGWKEAVKLELDCSITEEKLSWKPTLSFEETIDWTAEWYRKAYISPNPNVLRNLSLDQIDRYVGRNSAST